MTQANQPNPSTGVPLFVSLVDRGEGESVRGALQVALDRCLDVMAMEFESARTGAGGGPTPRERRKVVARGIANCIDALRRHLEVLDQNPPAE